MIGRGVETPSIVSQSRLEKAMTPSIASAMAFRRATTS
jgi:hypothetical protein